LEVEQPVAGNDRGPGAIPDLGAAAGAFGSTMILSKVVAALPNQGAFFLRSILRT
jgi:hypothetical protein